VKSKAVEELAIQWTASYATVNAFVHTLVTNAHDAEEVLQRVAVTLVRKYEEYDPRRPFIAWAIGFAKIEITRYLSKRASQRVVFDTGLVEQIAERYLGSSEDESIVSEFLDECIAELDDRARRAIELRYNRDLRTSQIAREMQLSDGAVRMLLSRARLLLRRCLEMRICQRHNEP
jgi:RNA polymerase sigma-70 factor (ECF subfamily)